MFHDRKHKKALAAARDRLAKLTRFDLLMRRSLLEAAIRAMEVQKIAWREQALDDDPNLTVEEQYELINAALSNLNSPPSQVIGLQAGDVDVKTFKIGE